jgi:hypothetical protein
MPLGAVEGTELGTAEADGTKLDTVEGTELGNAEGTELGTAEVEGTKLNTVEGTELHSSKVGDTTSNATGAEHS